MCDCDGLKDVVLELTDRLAQKEVMLHRETTAKRALTEDLRKEIDELQVRNQKLEIEVAAYRIGNADGKPPAGDVPKPAPRGRKTSG